MLYYYIESLMRLKSRFAATTATAAWLSLLVPLPALAQQATAQNVTAPSGSASQADGDHQAKEIVVTGSLQRNRQDVLSGVAVIQAAELTQALRPSIGETLQKTPGVSATSFGPTASRPV